MTTNHQQYEIDCRNAELTKAATIQTAVVLLQETININSVNAGNPPGRGLSQAAQNAIATAQTTYLQTALAAEATKQATITNSRAKNLLANGDTSPG
jgi:hypothetical protein